MLLRTRALCLLEPHELRDVDAAGTESTVRMHGPAGKGGEAHVVGAQKVALEALLRQELVSKRTAGSSSSARSHLHLWVLALVISEDGVREAPQRIRGRRALIRRRTRAPTSTHEFTQSRHVRWRDSVNFSPYTPLPSL